jgi:rod shape-determining protein MreC
MFLNVKLTVFNIRSVFLFLTYPIEWSVSAAGNFFAHSVTSFNTIQKLENELAFNKERLQRYQEEVLLLSQIKKENDDLRNTLDIKSRLNYTTCYAKVVFREPNLTGDYLIVNKGSLDGIKNNMPVVSYDLSGQIFLVGKVIEITLGGSKVKLITAADSSIGVMLKNSGYVGVMKGIGSWQQNCVVEFIPFEANSYVGEEVVTSGESDVFPPGILIGKVIGIGRNTMEEFYKKLFVKPEYKYGKLKDVFIIDWKPGLQLNDLMEKASEQ